jgi:hypothetical protein
VKERLFPLEGVARLLKSALVVVFDPDTGRFPIRIVEAADGDDAEGRSLLCGEGDTVPQLVEVDVPQKILGRDSIFPGWKLVVPHYTPATRHQPEDVDFEAVGSPFTSPTAAVTALVVWICTAMVESAMETEGWAMHEEQNAEEDATMNRLLAEHNHGSEAKLWNT